MNILTANLLLKIQQLELNYFKIWITKLFWNQLVGYTLYKDWMKKLYIKVNFTTSSKQQPYLFTETLLFSVCSLNLLEFVFTLVFVFPKKRRGERKYSSCSQHTFQYLCEFTILISSHEFVFTHICMHTYMHYLFTQLTLNSIKFE